MVKVNYKGVESLKDYDSPHWIACERYDPINPTSDCYPCTVPKVGQKVPIYPWNYRQPRSKEKRHFAKGDIVIGWAGTHSTAGANVRIKIYSKGFRSPQHNVKTRGRKAYYGTVVEVESASEASRHHVISAEEVYEFFGLEKKGT